MSIKDIMNEVRTFLINHCAVPENDRDFTNTVDLFSYGYIDSLGAADLASFVEGRFGISFIDAHGVAGPLSNIEDIAKFVYERQRGEA